MCVEYKTIKTNFRLLFYFNVYLPSMSIEEPDLFPLAQAPFIRKSRADSTVRECIPANFGLIPPWVKDAKKSARSCYNARTETVAEKPSFKNAFRRAQFGIIPCEAFYEPNYESGRAVRWRIEMASKEPFGIAGLWEWWPGDGAGDLVSFSMLTINADAHPLMRRFHKPGDEKRSVVILDPAHYDDWLRATPEEAPAFFQPYPADLMAAGADPRPVAPKPEVPTPRAKAQLF